MNVASKFPAAVYRETVLEQIFADAKRLFLTSLLEIDFAHLTMLTEQGIVERGVAKECLRALDALDTNEILATKFDGTFEDLFFLVEHKLIELCGEDNAGRIHTARSRNDIDMTMYRMVWRERLLQVQEAALALRHRLIELAFEHRASLMPAYTHNQPAQPTTLGHYFMALVEILERDAKRLQAAYGRVNRCPLGACAITTTGFAIDRNRTAHLLGFDGLQSNSYGAIAAVDYIAESCSALAVMTLSLGRFAQDMLLWSTAEFGYLRLSEGYVQISSIMPQKRNPVPLEHVRILSSRALAESQAVLASLHNTPFADMNDSEDPLQPLVDMAFTDSCRALTLMEGVLSEAEFNTERMLARARGSFLTVTELADTLVRSTGISFHKAHTVVSDAVHALAGEFDRERMVVLVVRALKDEVVASPDPEVLLRSLDAENFVKIRTIPGGPALETLERAIADSRARHHLDSERLSNTRERLRVAAQELHAVSYTLQNS